MGNASENLVVCIPKNKVQQEPIYLGLKNEIVLEENSEATVVELCEDFTGDREIRTDIKMGKNARLTHVKFLYDAASKFICDSSLTVDQSDASVFKSHVLDLGSKVGHHQLKATLNGQGAECYLNGLFILQGEQKSSHLTTIDHVAPQAMSQEFYKGMVGGSAEGTFEGKIIVRPNAQKTSARLSNKNVLLSKEALVHTNPILEIFANDVKCSHGATVGRLDENAIFYLRSRGLGLEEAKRLLMFAFADEVLGLFPEISLKDKMKNHIHSYFGRAA